jgi:hypothetical protein
MRVRRGTARLATVFTLLAALVAAGASPAVADGDKVTLHLPSSFNAGGSAGSVSVSVTRGSKGCQLVLTALAVRLPGLSAGQVQVETAAGGQWRPVAVSDGGPGVVVTGRSAPDQPLLCEHRPVSARYRLTFLAGAPAGEATVVAEASAPDGNTVGGGSGRARVLAHQAALPTPTAPARSASPSPTPVQTSAAASPSQSPVAVVAAPTAQSGQGGQGGGAFSGIGTVAMLLGVGMVGIGVALLVVLLRRGRGERAAGEAGVDPAGYADTQLLPGYPGIQPAPGGYPGAQPAAGGYPTVPQFPPPPPPAAAGGDSTAIMPRLP